MGSCQNQIARCHLSRTTWTFISAFRHVCFILLTTDQLSLLWHAYDHQADMHLFGKCLLSTCCGPHTPGSPGETVGSGRSPNPRPAGALVLRRKRSEKGRRKLCCWVATSPRKRGVGLSRDGLAGLKSEPSTRALIPGQPLLLGLPLAQPTHRPKYQQERHCRLSLA